MVNINYRQLIISQLLRLKSKVCEWSQKMSLTFPHHQSRHQCGLLSDRNAWASFHTAWCSQEDNQKHDRKRLLVKWAQIKKWNIYRIINMLHKYQIKSNHFYCHITTAQVPWWVKFLWACSRQCRKTTDNLPMDRQCKKKKKKNYIWTDSAKKTANNLHMDRQCKKTANNLHMDRVQKNCTGAFTVLQTVQKKNNNCNLHMDRQCKKTTAIYIWTVHIYRLYRRQCAKYAYIYSVRLVYYKDILNYQRHIHRMGTSTLCTVSIHNVVYT